MRDQDRLGTRDGAAERIASLLFSPRHRRHVTRCWRRPGEGSAYGAAARRESRGEDNQEPGGVDAGIGAAGKRVYSRLCVRCHGPLGKGDGGGAGAGGQPSDLTDATWDFGSSDGEIFAVIHDGTSADMEELRGADQRHRDLESRELHQEHRAERRCWPVGNSAGCGSGNERDG